MQAGQYVFEVGSTGDKFYFIIDGAIEVQLPDSQNIHEYNNVTYEIQNLEENIKTDEKKIKALRQELNQLKENLQAMEEKNQNAKVAFKIDTHGVYWCVNLSCTDSIVVRMLG